MWKRSLIVQAKLSIIIREGYFTYDIMFTMGCNPHLVNSNRYFTYVVKK